MGWAPTLTLVIGIHARTYIAYAKYPYFMCVCDAYYTHEYILNVQTLSSLVCMKQNNMKNANVAFSPFYHAFFSLQFFFVFFFNFES